MIFNKLQDHHNVLLSQSEIMMMMQEPSSPMDDIDNRIKNSPIEITILSKYIDYIVQLNDGKDLHHYGFPVGLILSWSLHNGHFGNYSS